MAGVSAAHDIRRDRELLGALQRLRAVGRSPRQTMQRVGLFARRSAQRRLRARPADWGKGRTLLSRSLQVVADDHAVRVGSNLVYAAIQQLGGDVRPKTGKYLAIPALGHLRRNGVWPRDIPKGQMKFSPAAFIRIGSHSWTGPALVRAVADVGGAERGAVIAQGRDESGRFTGDVRRGRREIRRTVGEVMYALIRKVRIKGRPYLMFGNEERAFALAEFGRAYERATRRRG